MGRLRKHASKRQTLRTKYKIQKKVKEHKRKQKKIGKTKQQTWKTRRDPGIPNDWPFKAELLADIERQKAEERAADAKRRAERKERAEQKKAKTLNAEDSALPASLTPSSSSSAVTTAPIDQVAARARQTLRILRSVVTSADLLLFVLDARDPLGSRWAQLEQRLAVTPAAPPLLFALSHCDLVPAAAVEAWLTYLNAEVPTVAFVSDRTLDTPEGKLTVEAETHKPLRCASVDALRQVVAGYRREAAEQKEAIGRRPTAATAAAAGAAAGPVSVAVLGFENVGKSSLINSLLRRHVCGVTAQAGFTKDVRVVTMGDAVRLLDTPGIPSLSSHPGPHITLPLDKAHETVSALVDALDPEMVTAAFRCSAFSSSADFLSSLAVKQGKYLKGGLPNTLTAARNLIRQWNTAQIAYYVYPPALQQREQKEQEEVGRMAAIFRDGNAKTVTALKAREVEAAEARRYIVLDASLFAAAEEEDAEEGGGSSEAEGDADEAGEETADSDDEDAGMEAAEDEEAAEEQQEAAGMDDAEQDADGGEMEEAKDEEEEEEEEEVFINPSPPQPQRVRPQRKRQLSVDTSRAMPILTPSKTQQRREQDEAKAEDRQQQPQDAQMVEQPDSPAKHTRLQERRKSAAAPTQPATASAAVADASAVPRSRCRARK